MSTIGQSAFLGCTALSDVFYLGTEEQWNAISIESNNEPLLSAEFHYAYISSGTCGDNLMWALDNEGVLTIAGNGEMPDYSSTPEPAPWSSHADRIEEIIIKDGVISIGGFAFFDGFTDSTYSRLRSITIPDSVISIGNYALQRCNTLTEISIPDSVTSIGEGAFLACTGLKSVELSDTLTSIGASAFLGCSSLTEIELPNSVTSMGENVFSGCSGLISIKLPDGLTRIDKLSFANCYSITEIIIPNSVTSIGDTAFSDCVSLANVELSNGLAEIGNSAFFNCSALSDITIPESVTSIGRNAFSGCNALKEIVFEGTAPGFIHSDGISNDFYPFNGVTATSKYPCNDTSWTESAKESAGGMLRWEDTHLWDEGTITTEPTYRSEGVKTITCKRECGSEQTEIIPSLTPPEGWFACGDHAIWKYDESTRTLYIQGEGDMWDLKSNENPPWNEHIGLIINVEVEEGITSIGANTFRKATKLSNFIMPDSVSAIGEAAFWGCSILESVSIPSSCSSVGEMAFYNCSSLKQVNIDEGLNTIGAFAFENCTNLVNISIPNSVNEIGAFAFSGCEKLESIIIPDGIQHIFGHTFYLCGNLNSVQLPDSITYIGEYAFFGCYRLKNISMPNCLMEIDNSAFQGCIISSVTFPRTITTIGNWAFCYCNDLKTITFLGGPPAIDGESFASVTADAFYPDNGSWWEQDRLDYGGTLTWKEDHSWDEGTITRVATCGEEGVRTYVCLNDGSHTKTESIPKIPHDWNEPTWAWDSANKATARFVCKNDSSHVETITASGENITKETMPSTYVTEGEDVCTATITLNGKKYTDSKTFPVVKRTLAKPVFMSIVNVKGGVQIKWDEVADATSYNVYRKAPGENDWNEVQSGITAHSFTDQNVTSNNKYSYTIKAAVSENDKTALSAYAASKSITYIAAPVISSLAKDNSGVQIKWGKVAGAAKYRIFRKTGSGSWAKLGDTTTLNYTDKTVKNGTAYSYTVRCLSSDGKSYTSAYDTTGKSIKPVANPALPTESSTLKGVQVKWTKVSGAEKYRLYRKTGTGKWTKLVDTTALSYVDTGVKSNTKYSYTLRCLSSDGKTFTSGYNTTGKAITFIAAPVISSVANVNGGVQIKWGKVAGAAKYRIFRKTGSGSWTKLGDTTAVNYTDKTAKSGTTYSYTVRCISSDGKSYTSGYNTTGKSMKYIAAPAVPKLAASKGEVTITWGKVAGAVNYRVFRKVGNGSWTKLGDTTSLTWTDKTVKAGTTYKYTIRCVSADGKTVVSGYNTTGSSIKAK